MYQSVPSGLTGGSESNYSFAGGLQFETSHSSKGLNPFIPMGRTLSLVSAREPSGVSQGLIFLYSDSKLLLCSLTDQYGV